MTKKHFSSDDSYNADAIIEVQKKRPQHNHTNSPTLHIHRLGSDLYFVGEVATLPTNNSNPFEKPKYETGRRAELGDIVLFEDKLYMLIEKNEDKIITWMQLDCSNSKQIQQLSNKLTSYALSSDVSSKEDISSKFNDFYTKDELSTAQEISNQFDKYYLSSQTSSAIELHTQFQNYATSSEFESLSLSLNTISLALSHVLSNTITSLTQLSGIELSNNNNQNEEIICIRNSLVCHMHNAISHMTSTDVVDIINNSDLITLDKLSAFPTKDQLESKISNFVDNDSIEGISSALKQIIKSNYDSLNARDNNLQSSIISNSNSIAALNTNVVNLLARPALSEDDVNNLIDKKNLAATSDLIDYVQISCLENSISNLLTGHVSPISTDLEQLSNHVISSLTSSFDENQLSNYFSKSELCGFVISAADGLIEHEKELNRLDERIDELDERVDELCERTCGNEKEIQILKDLIKNIDGVSTIVDLTDLQRTVSKISDDYTTSAQTSAIVNQIVGKLQLSGNYGNVSSTISSNDGYIVGTSTDEANSIYNTGIKFQDIVTNSKLSSYFSLDQNISNDVLGYEKIDFKHIIDKQSTALSSIIQTPNEMVYNIFRNAKRLLFYLSSDVNFDLDSIGVEDVFNAVGVLLEASKVDFGTYNPSKDDIQNVVDAIQTIVDNYTIKNASLNYYISSIYNEINLIYWELEKQQQRFDKYYTKSEVDQIVQNAIAELRNILIEQLSVVTTNRTISDVRNAIINTVDKLSASAV